MRVLVALLPLASTLLAQTPTAEPAVPAPSARLDVAKDLELAAAVARGEGGAGESTARLRVLRAAVVAAAAALGPTSLVGARLRSAASAEDRRDTGADDTGADAKHLQVLRSVSTKVAGDLRFTPLREAPVPEAWPAPAPVGEVVIKSYPAYRMAQAPMRSAGDMSAFWKLFQHLQSNDIPMTAPVQMDHAASNGAAIGERKAMAFLYTTTARGKLGTQGNVEVVDVPAATFVAIGARGYETSDDIEDLSAELRRWVREHAPRWEIGGQLRVMGWNSPSVRGDKRFYEVEMPLRLRREV